LLRLFYRRGVRHDVIIFPAARFRVSPAGRLFAEDIDTFSFRGRRVEGDDNSIESRAPVF
jgi:hypothetical protein